MAKNAYQVRRVERRRTSPEPARIPTLVPPTEPQGFKARWLPIIVIFVATIVAFSSTFDNEFVSWDDDHYVYKNHQVHYGDGIKSIWGDVFYHKDKKFEMEGRERRVSHQYYPLVFTLYWIEFRFHEWFNKANPNQTIEQNMAAGRMTATSFHVVNVVLHALTTTLVVLCLRRLGFSNWVACAAAALFALHPMQVASVAWVAERKNILSMMFYLLALMAYINLRRKMVAREQAGASGENVPSMRGLIGRYILVLVLFQAALFSKTATLTLPVTLFLTDRLLERRWDLRWMGASFLRIAPMLVMSAIAANTTMKVEDRDRTIPLTESQRPLLPAATLLFYVGKMLLPINQSPVYPLWSPNPASFLWLLPSLAVIAIGVLLVVFRRKLGSHFFWALALYAVIQFPMLGLKNINYFQFAFVADHYFYHGSVGLFAAAAMGLAALGRLFRNARTGFAFSTVLVAISAVALGAKSYAYSDVWQDAEKFWARTIEKNPQCWPAWYNTANARRRQANALIAEAKGLRAQAKALIDEAAQLEQAVAQLEAQNVSSPQAEEDRAKASRLREQAAELQAKIAPLQAEIDKLCDDAFERYSKVAEIHQMISQPIDQMYDIRRDQQRWADAADVAEFGTRRFPQLSRYHFNAAAAASKAGDLERAEAALRRGAIVFEQRGDAFQKAGDACSAGDYYLTWARLLSELAKVTTDKDSVRTEAQRARTKLDAAQRSCPRTIRGK